MAIEPVRKNYVSAVMGVAMASALAVCGNTSSVTSLYAQEATKVTSPTEIEPISKKECLQILGATSDIVGSLLKTRFTEPKFKGLPWDPEFALGFARMIAPTPELKTKNIHQVIVDGNVYKVSDPKTESGMKWLQDNYAAITCLGEKHIPASHGLPVIAAVGIQAKLGGGNNPIDLTRKGIVFYNPAEVAANAPATRAPAMLGPRSALDAPPFR